MAVALITRANEGIGRRALLDSSQFLAFANELVANPFEDGVPLPEFPITLAA